MNALVSLYLPGTVIPANKVTKLLTLRSHRNPSRQAVVQQTLLHEAKVRFTDWTKINLGDGLVLGNDSNEGETALMVYVKVGEDQFIMKWLQNV